MRKGLSSGPRATRGMGLSSRPLAFGGVRDDELGVQPDER